jgi:hypothetical protein
LRDRGRSYESLVRARISPLVRPCEISLKLNTAQPGCQVGIYFEVNRATLSRRILVAIALKRMDDLHGNASRHPSHECTDSLSLWPVRRSAKAFDVGVGEESASLIQALPIGQTAFDR